MQIDKQESIESAEGFGESSFSPSHKAWPSPDLELMILPLQRSLELATRIHVKGEGSIGSLVSVFRAVQDISGDVMRAKFKGSDLPDYRHLSKGLELPEEFVQACLIELAGLGSSQNRNTLILALPLLTLQGETDPVLKCTLVYVRPGSQEGTDISLYVDEVEKKNVATLSQWTMLRRPLSAKQQKEALEEALETNTSSNTIMQKRITKLFYATGNIPMMSPRIIYHNFVRPVIKKLIYKGSLLYVKASLGGDMLKGLYWNKYEELITSYEVFIESYNEEFGSDFQALNVEDEPAEVIASIAKAEISLQSLNARQRKITEELYLLCHALPTRKRKEVHGPKNEEAKGKEAELRDETIATILKFPQAVEASVLKVSPENLERVRNVDKILYTKYFIGHKVTSFYLHKDRVASALAKARGDIERYKDPTQAQVLSMMGIHELLDRHQIKEFQKLEVIAFYESLPWHIRLFRFLRRRQKLSPRELKELKEKNRVATQEKISHTEQDLHAKKIQRIAIEQVKETMKKGKEDAEKTSTENSSSFTKEKIELSKAQGDDDSIDKEAKRVSERIIEVLDGAWHSKIYPNRMYLLERIPEIDSENNLIFFMKKHCSHKVYSFFIKIDKPEYVWPIFITRRYLRRNGKKMLANTQKELKVQRETLMPNQERYDELVFIEEFLERILPKMSS